MVMLGTERDNLEMTQTARLLEDLHKNGVTYQSIADELGVDRRTIFRWHRSETHPTPQILTNDYLESRLQTLLEPASN